MLGGGQKDVMIGIFSFVDYSVCEIANVPMLEVLEIGDTLAECYNFVPASFMLKSCEGRLA